MYKNELLAQIAEKRLEKQKRITLDKKLCEMENAKVLQDNLALEKALLEAKEYQKMKEMDSSKFNEL